MYHLVVTADKNGNPVVTLVREPYTRSLWDRFVDLFNKVDDWVQHDLKGDAEFKYGIFFTSNSGGK